MAGGARVRPSFLPLRPRVTRHGGCDARLDAGGVELEARGKKDNITAFLMACDHGDAESVLKLAAAGCDTTAKTPSGQTGLILAVQSGNLDAVARVLHVGGSELEARDEDGGTAFLIACLKGQVEVVGALAKAGCDTTKTTSGGYTGLILAVRSGSAATVRAVMEVGGSELDAKDDDGVTAFLWACVDGHAECIPVLLEAGCNPLVTKGCEKRHLFLSFPYGCPEPVLAK